MRCYATETMTCVDRYIGSVLRLDGISFHYAAYRDGTTDDLYIAANWQDETNEKDISTYLQVELDSGTYPLEKVEGWDDPVCRIPYHTAPDRIFLTRRSAGITMTNGALTTDAVRVRPGQFTTLPVFGMDAVFYANYTHPLTWSVTPGDDRSGWVTGMEFRKREPGETDFTAQILFEDTRLTTCNLTIPAGLLGKEVCLMMEYRTYGADWDGKDPENFITLNQYVTPVQTVTRDAAVPLAPEKIETTLLIRGGRVTVSWPEVADPVNTIASYILERAVAAEGEAEGEFVCLYTGTSARFRDSLPEDSDTVRYRVCAVNAVGTASPWTDSGAMKIAGSNIYTGVDGRWIRAAAVWIGGRKASPMAVVGGK